MSKRTARLWSRTASCPSRAPPAAVVRLRFPDVMRALVSGVLVLLAAALVWLLWPMDTDPLPGEGSAAARPAEPPPSGLAAAAPTRAEPPPAASDGTPERSVVPFDDPVAPL